MLNLKYESGVLVANFGAGFEEMPGNGPRGEAAVMSCSSGLIRYRDNLSHRKIPKKYSKIRVGCYSDPNMTLATCLGGD